MIELSAGAIDVVIVARDGPAMLAFYGTTLGLGEDPVVHLSSGEGAVHKFQVGASRVRVVVLNEPPAAPNPDPGNVYAASGYRMFTLHVRDVADVARRCSAAGGAVTGPFSLRPGVELAVVHDPDGNPIEVLQAS